MTEKYIKLDEALKLVDESEDILNLKYLDVIIRAVNGEALKALLKQLPAIEVEGGERLDKAIEALKEKMKERKDEPAEATVSSLLCNVCTRYWYCSWDEGDSLDCPRYKPREPEREESEE